MKSLELFRLPYDKILPLALIKSYILQEKIMVVIPSRNIYNFMGVRITENPELEYKFDCGVFEGKKERMPPKSIHSDDNKHWGDV